MTDEEAEGYLRTLEGGLVENGAAELVSLVRRAARETGDDADSRATLAILLDELESVVVDLPRMVGATFEKLGASRLIFMTDMDDVRFTERGVRAPRPGDDDVEINSNILESLLGNAEEAGGLIAELKRRIYE